MTGPAPSNDAAEFAATAESFTNPDWVRVTLNAYRAPFLAGEVRDPRYDLLERRLRETATLSCPALMVQGAADSCDEPQSSQGLDRFFTGAYSRIVLNGVGHFPHREAPLEAVRAVLGHLEIHDHRG